ncbi:MAG: Tfp pilus assembly protein FimT/FimU, partial [Ruminococcus sp.]
MAKLIRGFSLVELIVVLTIMAIIAALCAPNISAYVQAAKIQNYQTALDNLVGEVQTQLPQSRYWNWQEVQENAEAILRSDAARGVTESSSTDNSVTYTITNASTDGNITYEITITYANKNNTAQAVTVSGECSQFSVVKAEETCDVLLKTNYTD